MVSTLPISPSTGGPMIQHVPVDGIERSSSLTPATANACSRTPRAVPPDSTPAPFPARGRREDLGLLAHPLRAGNEAERGTSSALPPARFVSIRPPDRELPL